MILRIMDIYLLLLILSIVQSLFGVGILLFGTPFLLMMGYEYTEALLYLLPASAALSWSQVRDYRHLKLDGGYRKLFFLICLPSLFGVMYLAKNLDLKWEIRLFVTIMLVVAFFMRTNSTLRVHLQNLMKSHLPAALGLMGLIHGLSNMGGAILTPLVSGLYKEKEKVLAAVSFDYAFMASFQLIILIFVKQVNIESKYLVGSLIAVTVRTLIGQRVYAFTTENFYQKLINGLILASAFTLGINL